MIALIESDTLAHCFRQKSGGFTIECGASIQGFLRTRKALEQAGHDVVTNEVPVNAHQLIRGVFNPVELMSI